MNAGEVWARERPRLVALAYRMLGTVSDADDVVQDVGLTWLTTDVDTVDNPAAYLTTLVSRRAIDRLRSAAVRRTSYVGPWLPEPLLMVDDAADPAETAAIAESVTIGFLTVLERLEPLERAVFLLHDVFDEPFDDIARIVDRTPAACRQIAHRAAQRVRAERRVAAPVDSDRRDRLLAAFLGAVGSGQLDVLRSMLRSDAVLVSDGGATRRAARRPIIGPDRIARFLVNLQRKVPHDAHHEVVPVNGTVGVLTWWAGEPQLLVCADIAGDQITALWMFRADEKLRRFAR